MLVYIYFILITLNLVCLMIRKKSKILLVINFIFAFVLFWGNSKNADYSAYFLMYNKNMYRNEYEIGFNFCMDFCNKIGLSFDLFKGIIWIVAGGIYLKIFSEYSKNYSVFFITYYIYCIFVDIIQIRSFFATALVCMSLYYYFKNMRIKSIIWMVFAISIHIESAFFIPLIIFINPNVKISLKVLKLFSIIIVIMCIFSVILNTQNNQLIVSIGKFALILFNAELKSQSYFNTVTRYGGVLYSSLHLFIIIIYSKLQKILSLNIEKSICESKEQLIYNQVFLLQLYCVISFPLILININFYRIYKMIFLYNSIIYAVILDSYTILSTKYYKSLFLGLLPQILFRFPIIHGVDQINLILENNFVIKYFM